MGRLIPPIPTQLRSLEHKYSCVYCDTKRGDKYHNCNSCGALDTVIENYDSVLFSDTSNEPI